MQRTFARCNCNLKRRQKAQQPNRQTNKTKQTNKRTRQKAQQPNRQTNKQTSRQGEQCLIILCVSKRGCTRSQCLCCQCSQKDETNRRAEEQEPGTTHPPPPHCIRVAEGGPKTKAQLKKWFELPPSSLPKSLMEEQWGIKHPTKNKEQEHKLRSLSWTSNGHFKGQSC
jgi:hypothetical protein